MPNIERNEEKIYRKLNAVYKLPYAVGKNINTYNRKLKFIIQTNSHHHLCHVFDNKIRKK